MLRASGGLARLAGLLDAAAASTSGRGLLEGAAAAAAVRGGSIWQQAAAGQRSYAQPALAEAGGGGAAAAAAAAALQQSILNGSTQRTGLVAVKVGMTQEWDAWGVRVPLTVLWVDDCQVRRRAVRHEAHGMAVACSTAACLAAFLEATSATPALWCSPPRHAHLPLQTGPMHPLLPPSCHQFTLRCCPQVVQVKTDEREGYTALQLGAGAKRAKQLRGSLRGHFEAAGEGYGQGACDAQTCANTEERLPCVCCRPGSHHCKCTAGCCVHLLRLVLLPPTGRPAPPRARRAAQAQGGRVPGDARRAAARGPRAARLPLCGWPVCGCDGHLHWQGLPGGSAGGSGRCRVMQQVQLESVHGGPCPVGCGDAPESQKAWQRCLPVCSHAAALLPACFVAPHHRVRACSPAPLAAGCDEAVGLLRPASITRQLAGAPCCGLYWCLPGASQGALVSASCDAQMRPGPPCPGCTPCCVCATLA